MKKIPLPNERHSQWSGILVAERSDYPLTVRKVEQAAKELGVGIAVWTTIRTSRNTQRIGIHKLVFDPGNGPVMFKTRKDLIAMIRLYNEIWRDKKGDWPRERAPD